MAEGFKLGEDYYDGHHLVDSQLVSARWVTHKSWESPVQREHTASLTQFIEEDDVCIPYKTFTGALKLLKSHGLGLVGDGIPSFPYSTYLTESGVIVVHTDRHTFGDSGVNSLELQAVTPSEIEELARKIGLYHGMKIKDPNQIQAESSNT